MDAGSNEITAIPALLDLLFLKGCVVSLDAMGTQTEIASKIRSKQAHYVLALKSNQRNFWTRVKNRFAWWREYNDFQDFPVQFYEAEIEKAHGRIEKRRYWQMDIRKWKEMATTWKDLKTIAIVESEREVNEKISLEIRYYISSLELNVQKISDVIRQHWSIENKLHHCLDVTWKEDQSRIRMGNATENLAILRRTALNLLRRETSLPRESIKGRMEIAGWSEEYLMKVLCAC
jgi:predicted transposase YbfD/YdcC